MFDEKEIAILQKSLYKLQEGFLLPDQGKGDEWQKVEKILFDVAEKMQNNYTYFLRSMPDKC